MSNDIRMCDLLHPYLQISEEIHAAMAEVMTSTSFINGPQVKTFAQHLAAYLGVERVVPCGNGTDALQIALMALGLQPGDEVIVPAFTYVASAEVIALLGLKPVLVDVNPDTFLVEADAIEQAVLTSGGSSGNRSCPKAVIPVHLFGQSCPMPSILEVAGAHRLYVVEDNAQALGARCRMADGTWQATGTIGDVGCTSFFPTKNLGCMGDGGAMMTQNPELADRLHRIANHGQRVKYRHDEIGCNSRLDTLQAAILDVKLKYLDQANQARQQAASRYRALLADLQDVLQLPVESPDSTHVYHQYTLVLREGQRPGPEGLTRRDALKAWLQEHQIPSTIYYPYPLHHQPAYRASCRCVGNLPVATQLAGSVLSLPMHTALTSEQQQYIADVIHRFFQKYA